jgi:hypothetical protein
MKDARICGAGTRRRVQVAAPAQALEYRRNRLPERVGSRLAAPRRQQDYALMATSRSGRPARPSITPAGGAKLRDRNESSAARL